MMTKEQFIKEIEAHKHEVMNKVATDAWLQ